MAQNFDAPSTQGAILYTFDSDPGGGTQITLTDSDGRAVASFTSAKAYACVVVSAPQIEDGATYTLTSGSQSVQITMSGLIYGSGCGMGGG
jgi:hypothetical protein